MDSAAQNVDVTMIKQLFVIISYSSICIRLNLVSKYFFRRFYLLSIQTLGNDSLDQVISALLANNMFMGCLSARILDNVIPGTVRLLLCVCLHSHPSHIYTGRRLFQLFKLSMYTRINWLLTFPFGVLKGGIAVVYEMQCVVPFHMSIVVMGPA